MKSKLLDIIKNPANKLIAVDLDGTLCEGEFWGDEDPPKPLLDRIEFVNQLYRKGAHIVIYTARAPKYYEKTQNWLMQHSVSFHGIAMKVKIGADCYIDDKALHISDVFTN